MRRPVVKLEMAALYGLQSSTDVVPIGLEIPAKPITADINDQLSPAIDGNLRR